MRINKHHLRLTGLTAAMENTRLNTDINTLQAVQCAMGPLCERLSARQVRTCLGPGGLLGIFPSFDTKLSKARQISWRIVP